MKKNARPQGQVRQSQIVTTFGPGAMVDLTDYAAIVGGLEHWHGTGRRLHEERLQAKIQALLNLPKIDLYEPPIDSGNPDAPRSGITAWQFPEWFIAQGDEMLLDGFRSRPMVHRHALVGGKYLGTDKRKYRVIPVRFVQACPNGHISDIDWYGFVHGFEGDCRRQLWMDELGTSGDLADIFVRCECKQRRSLAQATRRENIPLSYCKGLRPWLGPASQEKCGGAEASPTEPAIGTVGEQFVLPSVIKRHLDTGSGRARAQGRGPRVGRLPSLR